MEGKYKVDDSPSSIGGYPEYVTKDSTDGTNFDRMVTINDTKVSTVEKETAYRYGNASKVRCEIRYGRDDSIYQLKYLYIDYIKVP